MFICQRGPIASLAGALLIETEVVRSPYLWGRPIIFHRTRYWLLEESTLQLSVSIAGIYT